MSRTLHSLRKPNKKRWKENILGKKALSFSVMCLNASPLGLAGVLMSIGKFCQGGSLEDYFRITFVSVVYFCQSPADYSLCIHATLLLCNYQSLSVVLSIGSLHSLVVGYFCNLWSLGISLEAQVKLHEFRR